MTDPTINERKLGEIIQQCKNRMDVSYYKYGPARENFGGGRVDAPARTAHDRNKHRRVQPCQQRKEVKS